jgi:hypothetical protein
MVASTVRRSDADARGVGEQKARLLRAPDWELRSMIAHLGYLIVPARTVTLVV